VHHTFEADAFFPIIKEEEWVLQQSELQLKDDKHQFDYSYQTYLENKKH
jgi:dihydrofolate reductase